MVSTSSLSPEGAMTLNKVALANSLAVLTAALYVLFAILALVAPRGLVKKCVNGLRQWPSSRPWLCWVA